MADGSYNQFCPVAMAAEILCTRWTIVLLRELVAGSTRFNELRRGVPRMSPALLSKRLKDLEAAGIVARSQLAGDPAFYEYTLTSAGKDLGQVVFAIGEWGTEMGDDRVIALQVGPQPADVGYAPEHQHQAAATTAQYDPNHLFQSPRSKTELVADRRAGRRSRSVLGRSWL